MDESRKKKLDEMVAAARSGEMTQPVSARQLLESAPHPAKVHTQALLRGWQHV